MCNFGVRGNVITVIYVSKAPIVVYEVETWKLAVIDEVVVAVA